MASFLYSPWLHLGAIVVLSATLSIVLSLSLFFKNLESMVISWGSQVEMNIYMTDHIVEKDRLFVESELKKTGIFKDIQYLTKEKSIDGFFSKMSRYVPEFSNDKEFLNIIPSSYLGTLEGSLPIAEIQGLAKKIMNIAGVEDVSYGQEWIENFSSFLGVVKAVSLLISLVLLFGGILVLGFISYVFINKRREEVEIYELCGATQSMIQLPFVFEGGVLATLSSGIALIVSFFILQIQNKFIYNDVGYLGFQGSFQFFSALQILLILVLAMMFGMFTTYIFIRKVNTGWAAAGV